jgi:asparagine synthase (glutamine-hydrolysing)
MCGIAGIFNLGGQPADKDTLRAMNDRLVHRGPDGGAFVTRGPVGLAHRRLSIIDLSENGRQPMCNEDGTVWLTFNGEIYNFQELRRELVRKGHRFHSQTDSEVVVHLYEEEGDRFVTHLRGMFALAIWDERSQRLLLARDRFGIKPLHYYHDGQTCLFASEIKSLLAHPGVDQTIAPEAIRDFFVYGYVPDPDSIYRNVRKLPAGHMLSVTSHDQHLWSYWTLDYDTRYELTREQLHNELRQRLLEAVECHMVSDVPIGAFLSGGVDSSSVVAMLHRLGLPVKTFSVCYSDSEFDEGPFARAVAERLGTEHHEAIVDPAEMLDLIGPVLDQFDEPFGDSSAVATWVISFFAAKHVKVILSGDGGDEMFAGYARHVFANDYGERTRRHWYRWLKKGLRATSSFLPPGRLRKAFYLRSLLPMESYGNRVTVFSETLPGNRVESLFAPALRSLLVFHEPYCYLKRVAAPRSHDHFLNTVRYLDTHSYLPNDNLVKVDRMSMAHSLEVRVPFLDHRLAEFAASVPPLHLVQAGQGKLLLKQAMADDLPHQCLFRRKMGFMLPLKNWFRNELAPVARALANDSALLASSWFETREIRRLVLDHLEGRADNSGEIWLLMAFDRWLQREQRVLG